MSFRKIFPALALVLCLGFPAFAQDWGKLDKTIQEVLSKTAAPSTSVVIWREGQVVYRKATGLAQVAPCREATPEMRYCVGSVSKQFTAAAVLLLAEEGKLSLSDRVSRWFPDLTRARDINLRQLLTMTAGYTDFWPQDFAVPAILQPNLRVMEEWGTRPLDFEPSTRWQYSNTNYTIAGRIVERVSQKPLFEFLQQRVFQPLHMDSVVDVNASPLPAGEPVGYLRYALGRPKPAPREGAGWLFAIGSLAMTATDLAKWDRSLIEESLLQPASYRLLEEESQLLDGTATRYGLGLFIGHQRGHRQLSHGGEISGFTAINCVYPEDRLAFSVLTNLDATDAPGQIAAKIMELAFAYPDDARVRRMFEELQQGRLDPARASANLQAYFTPQALADFASSLGSLGSLREIAQTSESQRGGMTFRVYRLRLEKARLRLTVYLTAEGKFEQFQVSPD